MGIIRNILSIKSTKKMNKLYNSQKEVHTNFSSKQKRFELLSNKVLGYGAFSHVVVGKDNQKGNEVAIKVINKKKVSNYITQIKREVEIHLQLKHHHIIDIIDYYEDPSNIYIVMKLAKNGNLFNYLQKKRILQENEAFIYFFQTLLAIDYLHKKSVTHRDLKPENLLFDENANICVCDFGWSINGNDSKLLKSFCGTWAYMAPE